MIKIAEACKTLDMETAEADQKSLVFAVDDSPVIFEAVSVVLSCDFIVKPYKPDRLLGKIAKHIVR